MSPRHRPFLDAYSEQIGPVGSAFIIGHEIGHHISYLLGWIRGVNMSIKQNELQADCFSGTWASAVDYVYGFTSDELNAASQAVISTGSPISTWFDPTVHGTASQRLTAFEAGFLNGPFVCVDPAWLGQFPLAEGETLKVPFGEGAQQGFDQH